MIKEYEVIDEYVRRAMPAREEALASLAEPQVQQALLERILSEPVTDRAAPSARTRWSLAIAGGAATVLVVAGAVVAQNGQGPDRSPPVAGPTATAAPSANPTDDSVALDGGALDCVETYPVGLARRGVAFDGTVIEIGEPGPPDAHGFIDYVRVTFRVEEWFRGGEGERFTLWVMPPDVVSSIDNPAYEIGSRLLVSGEEETAGAELSGPMAWYCGFTRGYGPGTAEHWRQVFAG